MGWFGRRLMAGVCAELVSRFPWKRPSVDLGRTHTRPETGFERGRKPPPAPSPHFAARWTGPTNGTGYFGQAGLARRQRAQYSQGGMCSVACDGERRASVPHPWVIALAVLPTSPLLANETRRRTLPPHTHPRPFSRKDPTPPPSHPGAQTKQAQLDIISLFREKDTSASALRGPTRSDKDQGLSDGRAVTALRPS